MGNQRAVRRVSTVCLAAAIWFAAVAAGCDDEQKIKAEQAYRLEGIQKIQNGDYESAIEKFNLALNERAGKVTNLEEDINFYKAYAQIEAGRTEDAVDTYTALVEYNKKNADAYYLRGLAYMSMGDTKLAAEDFRQAVSYKKDSGTLYAGIYEQLMKAGLLDEAAAYLEEGVKIKGDDGPAYLSRGRLYLASGVYDKAKEELEHALRKGEKEANLYLGETERAQGNNAQAMPYYKAYAEDHKDDAEVLYAMGKIAFEDKDYAQAISYFEQGLNSSGVVSKRKLWSGKIAALEHQGDFKSAKKEIKAYLKSYPEDEAAKRELIFLKTR